MGRSIKGSTSGVKHMCNHCKANFEKFDDLVAHIRKSGHSGTAWTRSTPTQTAQAKFHLCIVSDCDVPAKGNRIDAFCINHQTQALMFLERNLMPEDIDHAVEGLTEIERELRRLR